MKTTLSWGTQKDGAHSFKRVWFSEVLIIRLCITENTSKKDALIHLKKKEPDFQLATVLNLKIYAEDVFNF